MQNKTTTPENKRELGGQVDPLVRGLDACDTLMKARAALKKTMEAWGGTCAWHNDVKNAINAIDSADCKNGLYKKELGELLAILHRDGGQYLQKHGWVKSIEDAKQIAARLVVI